MKVDIKLNRRDLSKIKKMPDDYLTGFKKGLGFAAKFLEAQIKKSIGKPGRPQVRTGNLRRSVASKRIGVNAFVEIKAKYANIQEEGGVIKGKPWLMFKIGNNFIKTNSVTIPARPYIQPAIDESEFMMAEIIKEEIVTELNRR